VFDQLSHPTGQGDKRRRGVDHALFARRDKTADKAPVPALEIAELRERCVQAQLLPVAAVDPRHEWLDDALVHFATEAPYHELGDRLLAQVPWRGHRRFVRERRPAHG
jgi:hypothetical protein